MATQTMQTPEDKFKKIWLELFIIINKAEEKFSTLQISSVVSRFPEVKRNLELAYQCLENMQNRLHKVNDTLDKC